MNYEAILETLHFRHACKEFDETKKISDLDAELILKAGQLSPSSMGLEPWKFLVITNQELREELASVSWGGKKQIPSCSHLVILLSRKPNDLKHDSAYIDYLLKDVKGMPEVAAQNFKNMIQTVEENRFNHNEAAILNYSCLQTYLAAANMMTIAAIEKIDSCAIGGYDQKAVEDILIKHNLLDSSHFHLTLMLAFGYRVHEATPKKRQSLNEVVQWVK